MSPMQQPHPIEHVALDERQQDTAEIVREAGAVLYDLLAAKLPEGRYKSLALTGFEIAMMWATKAISHTPR